MLLLVMPESTSSSLIVQVQIITKVLFTRYCSLITKEIYAHVCQLTKLASQIYEMLPINHGLATP